MKVMWTKKYAIAAVCECDTEQDLARAILSYNCEPLKEVLFDSVEEALDSIKEEEEKVGRIAGVVKVGDAVYVRCGPVWRKDSVYKIYLVEIAEEM